MGKINKDANLYDYRGRLMAKAPLQNIEPRLGFGQPLSRKYPGGNNFIR